VLLDLRDALTQCAANFGRVAELRRNHEPERHLLRHRPVVATYHATRTEHFTCSNSQTEATCTSTPSGYSRSTSTPNALFSSTSGNLTPLLWADTDTTLQAAATPADGDRATKTTFALNADVAVYQLRPLVTSKQSTVSGVPTTYAKSARTWDA